MQEIFTAEFLRNDEGVLHSLHMKNKKARSNHPPPEGGSKSAAIRGGVYYKSLEYLKGRK
ncbi:MAG: hypothetical protein EBS06_02415 [Proteobacteria bacterium]|nr:hypothetical protein [Pseudomonadota bacterium]